MTALVSPSSSTVTRSDPLVAQGRVERPAIIADEPKPNVAGDGTDPRAAAEAVAKALSSSKNLEVTSFHDEATGRFVTRVADRWSGRVLVQTPPNDLLRFLATAPTFDPPPTLIDA
ncbi:MAG: hypothetical protein AAFX81_07890 [Pseudomonadota bacterium]